MIGSSIFEYIHDDDLEDMAKYLELSPAKLNDIFRSIRLSEKIKTSLHKSLKSKSSIDAASSLFTSCFFFSLI